MTRATYDYRETQPERGQFYDKLRPLDVDRFDAFKITSCSLTGNTIHAGTFDTLEDAANAAAGAHKTQAMVKQTNELTGKITLHFFQTIQKAAIWKKNAAGVPEQVKPLELKPLFTLELTDEITGPTALTNAGIEL